MIDDIKKIAEARLAYIILNWRENLDNTMMTPQGLAQTLMEVLVEEFGYQIRQPEPEPCDHEWGNIELYAKRCMTLRLCRKCDTLQYKKANGEWSNG